MATTEANTITARQAKASRTKERIMLTARDAFTEAGYEAVSMRDIAADAYVSTGAIFAHFTGKAELFKAAMGRDAPMERLHGWLRSMAAAEDGAGESPQADFARQMLVDLWGVDA